MIRYIVRRSMMQCKRIFPVFFLVLVYLFVQGSAMGHVYAQGAQDTNQPVKKENPKKPAATTKGRVPADPYLKEITKKGNMIFVSKNFSDLVRKNNALVLSKVAVKQRIDEEGKVVAYELVQVDRKSVVEKMGFRPGDLVTSVNGVAAPDLLANQKTLEQGNSFEVTVLRNGKSVKMLFEVR